jgi:hypothetical protein
MALGINDIDRYECRPAWMICRLLILLVMPPDPCVNGIDGAANFMSNLCDGRVGFKDEGNGLLANLGGVADTWHVWMGAGTGRTLPDGQADDANIILEPLKMATMRLLEQLRLKRSQIELLAGETSPQKRFLIREITPEELAERIRLER